MPHYDESRGLLSNVVAQNATLVATATHAAASKATPDDADELPLADSTTSFSLKKLTWANLKATLASWLLGGTIPISVTTMTASGAITGVQSITLTGTGSATRKTSMYTGPGVGNSFNIYSGVALSGAMQPINFQIGDIGTGSSTALTLDATGIVAIGGTNLMSTSSALTNGAGASVGTLTNAPAAGNPTKWIQINDNGVTRRIPAW